MRNGRGDEQDKCILEPAMQALEQRKSTIVAKKYKRNKLITSLICLVLVCSVVGLTTFIGIDKTPSDTNYLYGSVATNKKEVVGLQANVFDQHNVKAYILPPEEVYQEFVYLEDEKILLVTQKLNKNAPSCNLHVYMPKNTFDPYKLKHVYIIKERSYDGMKVLVSGYSPSSQWLATWESDSMKYFLSCRCNDIDSHLDAIFNAHTA